jgi:hypothetical protein
MTTRSSAASLALLLAPFFLIASLSQAPAGSLFCPVTVFCKPKPPHVRYKCICPQRIKPGCGLENYGYYPTCWQPWPFPPNYGHCAVPPPTVTPQSSAAKTAETPEELPAPAKEQPELESPKTTEDKVKP